MRLVVGQSRPASGQVGGALPPTNKLVFSPPPTHTPINAPAKTARPRRIHPSFSAHLRRRVPCIFLHAYDMCVYHMCLSGRGTRRCGRGDGCLGSLRWHKGGAENGIGAEREEEVVEVEFFFPFPRFACPHARAPYLRGVLRRK
jgi:hypothetical protein